MESNTILYKPLGDVIELLTDYHANGAYEKLKENVTLLDKENHAVMIRTTNFEANDFTNNLIYIDEHAYEFLKKSKVYASDLIMNKIANPGTVYFMPEISKPVSLGMNLFLIRVNPKKANPYFIYAYLRKNEHYVKSFASGSTTKTITKDDVRRLKIFMPPLQEQNKTAQILSTWDQAISATEKLLENSQQQKKALMQQLLTGKKRLLDENGVKFSNEWATKNLESLVYRPLCYGVLKPGEDVLDGHPLIRIQDIDDRGFIDIRKVIRITDELHYEFRRTILNTNDLIISIVGTLGKVFVIPKELNGANITRAFAVIGADCKLIDTRFIYQYLNSSMIQEWLLNTATGNAQKVLNIAALKELQIPLPIIEEQRRIAEVLFVADQEIETIQKKLDCLKQEKKALMQQLLTGKKRVKVAA
ncbi:restriction endonuclease subunit S [Acinetobacter sp. SwsAc3]|nr:restriction endonuclease subunit S [Acinetobacter sp. SwsAc3]